MNRRELSNILAVAALVVSVSPGLAAKKGKPRPKPLKVVILAGQSNMEKRASWTTLKGLADSPETKPLYDKLVDKTGKVRVHKGVREAIFEWVTDERGRALRDENNRSIPKPRYGAPIPHKFGGKVLGVDEVRTKFGAGLTFGVTLHEHLDGPILIINTAVGGKSLNYHYRPAGVPEWQPPRGHPEHPETTPAPLPIPMNFKLPADFKPPTRYHNNMQVMGGIPMGKMFGIHPVYVNKAWTKGHIKEMHFQKGDIILGINGAGLPESPVNYWRNTWFSKVRKGDWMMKVTRFRPTPELGPGKGKIETVTIDTAKLLKDGRAGIPAYLAEEKAKREKLLKEGGEFYQQMMKRIKYVLKYPKYFYPEYDRRAGYEVVGFVWFHGYNDMIDSTTYPYGHTHPRGFEQYGWLLGHLIRNVRKELDAPNMPAVIGVKNAWNDPNAERPFPAAQAAVADFEDLKGNVSAVTTGRFMDTRIDEILTKHERVMAYEGNDPNHPFAKLKAKIIAFKKKMGDPDKLEDRRAAGRLRGQIRKGIIDIVRTDEEKEYLANNVSDASFHYHGSPKFFARAGVAFAEALVELIQQQKKKKGEPAMKRKR